MDTDRLILGEANGEDAPFFFQLLNSSGWLQFIGDRGIKTMEDARAYIENSLVKSYRENGYGLYKLVLKESSIPIGICGLVNRNSLPHPDLGFALLGAYEGKGYAWEASVAILEQAKVELHLKRVLAVAKAANHRSVKLLEKIGMHLAGKIKLEEAEPELLLYEIALATEK